jgi:hypothetical protein
LALTNTALTTASNAVIEASSVLASLKTIGDGYKGLYRHIKRHISFLQHSYCRRFRGKTTKVEASKQANAAFLSEITALDAVKKTEAHASIITTFNNSHQMLQTQTSDLDAIVKKVFADAEAHRKTQFWQHSLGVANAALATATSAEVDANNALASITALLAVVKAVLVNANCVSQDAARE